MNCPLCKTELKMSERSGIEIDYCPQCRGVWLDKGELDKIIERNAAEALPPQKNNYGNDSRYSEKEKPYDGGKYYTSEKDYKQRKKKSFLDDLFDF